MQASSLHLKSFRFPVIMTDREESKKVFFLVGGQFGSFASPGASRAKKTCTKNSTHIYIFFFSLGN